jgi:membrane protein
MPSALRWFKLVRLAFWRVLVHDGLSVAKGAAYSSILTLFPALMVVTHLLARSYRTEALLNEIEYAVGRILPPGTTSAVIGFVSAPHHHSTLFIATTTLLTLWSATGIMFSWMDGFRRAYQLPNVWGFWKSYGIAFLMVFLSILPMALATLLVVFGKQIENWMIMHSQEHLGAYVLLLWTGLRWVIAILTSVAVLAVLYHYAVPRTQPWPSVLPGATLATVLWFAATALFGIYLQYYANYRVLYGSLATAIVLLVWLYIVSAVILVGAEFNAMLFPRVIAHDARLQVRA